MNDTTCINGDMKGYLSTGVGRNVLAIMMFSVEDPLFPINYDQNSIPKMTNKQVVLKLEEHSRF